MTIDLKWTLPFVTPVALLALFRVMWWIAGAEWNEQSAGMAAWSAALIGSLAAGFLLGYLIQEKPDALKVRIGGTE